MIRHKFINFFKGLFSKIQVKGSFVYNSAWVFSNKGLAVILAFIFTPIFSRIFSPEDYGIFSLYVTCLNNIVVFSTLGYSDALMFVRSKSIFYSLFFFSSLVLCSTLIVVSGAIPFILEVVLDAPSESVSFLYPLILGGFLLTSIQLNFQKLNHFYNQFKRGSTIGILTNLSNRGITLGIGFLNPNIGLFYGDVLSKAISFLIHLIIYFKEIVKHKKFVNKRFMYWCFKKFRHYPLYVLPSRQFEVLANHLPLIFISRIFGVSSLGQFGLVIGLISVPMNLFANSMQATFVRRIRDVDNTERVRLVTRLYKTLAILIVIPSVALGIFLNKLLPWYLGNQWVMSGELATPMIIVVFAMIIDKLLIGFLQLTNNERRLFTFRSIHLVILVFFFVLSEYFFDQSIIQMIQLYALILISLALYRVDYILKLAHANVRGLNAAIWIFLSSVILIMMLNA